MSIWIRVNGYAATEVAAHTPPTWETWADGGSGKATWTFALTPRAQHQALRINSVVEIMIGPLSLYSGTLTEFNRNTGECVSYGLASAAKDYLALTGAGSGTRVVETAVATAIAAGWQAANPTPVTGTVTGDATGNPISVADLLTRYAEQTGQRWGVDRARRLFMRPDPTTATWIASPDATAFGTTNDDRAAKLYGRYLDSGTGLYATAFAGAGTPQAALSELIANGEPLTRTQADAILAGMLTLDRAQTGWINGVTLTRDQLQTIGGTPAALFAVRAGQVMRSFGLPYAESDLRLDTVIGKTRYTAGEDTIYVEPVNTAPRTHRDVLAGKATR